MVLTAIFQFNVVRMVVDIYDIDLFEVHVPRMETVGTHQLFYFQPAGQPGELLVSKPCIIRQIHHQYALTPRSK